MPNKKNCSKEIYELINIARHFNELREKRIIKYLIVDVRYQWLYISSTLVLLENDS